MRLLILRKINHVSQQKMALDLNISQTALSRYETNAREADYATLILIADYFNVSLDYLLERSDDSSPFRSYTNDTAAHSISLSKTLD